MKLFLIIYLAGHVGGYAGPLPYGLAECLSRAAAMQADADAHDVPLTFRCEYRGVDNRPVLGDAQRDPI